MKLQINKTWNFLRLINRKIISTFLNISTKGQSAYIFQNMKWLVDNSIFKFSKIQRNDNNRKSRLRRSQSDLN